MSPLPNRSSLSDISERFALNLEQHTMFKKMVSTLASTLCKVTPPQAQVVSFLQGPAGFGKSQVIKALIYYCQNWDQTDAIKTVAFQGTAAMAIGPTGQTLHNLMGWPLRPQHTPIFKPKTREILSLMKFLIIDEITMLPLDLLGALTKGLQNIHNNNTAFGGIHVMFVGDWLQLKPVGPPCCLKPTPSETANKYTFARLLSGYEAYMSINYVVSLTQNHRHKSNPHWVHMMNRIRMGLTSEDDMNTLNNACYPPTKPVQLISNYCPIITPSNYDRDCYNKNCTTAFARLHNLPIHRLNSEYTTVLSTSDIKHLLTLTDDKTDRLAIQLNIVIGMPIMCTRNMPDRRFQMSNGSLGFLVNIQKGPNLPHSLNGSLFKF